MALLSSETGEKTSSAIFKNSPLLIWQLFHSCFEKSRKNPVKKSFTGKKSMNSKGLQGNGGPEK